MDAHSEIAAVATPGEAPAVMQALLDTIEARVEPERRDAVTAFAKAFLRRLAPEEIVESGAEGLFGLVRSAFAFADARGTQPSAVRVFDPDGEHRRLRHGRHGRRDEHRRLAVPRRLGA